MPTRTSNSIDISQWLPAIRQIPGVGDKLSQALQYIVDGVNQGHANAAVAGGGPLAPPPAPDDFKVNTCAAGFAYFGIKHNGNIQRGIEYFIEHADNPAFQNAEVMPLGTSRNAPPLYIGNATRYFRCYAMYPGSNQPSGKLNFGGTNPTAVTGQGSTAPNFTGSFGSGTCPTDGSVSGAGFGPVLYRQAGSAQKRNLS
jgi:hypothetical protein